MRMHFAVTRIDHQPLTIRLIYKHFQQFFPHATIAPTTKTALYFFPFSKVWRKIAPRRTRSQNPKYRIDKQSIIR
jgi:hypothetical protein